MNEERLRAAIKKRGITVSELCEEISISRSSFYKKLNGTSDFTLSEIKSIMKLLSIKTPVGIFF